MTSASKFHPPELAAAFISAARDVVLLTPVLITPPESYALDGCVLTVYDRRKWQLRDSFTLDAAAAAQLDAGRQLIVAEVDDAGPARTTTNVRRVQ